MRHRSLIAALSVGVLLALPACAEPAERDRVPVTFDQEFADELNRQAEQQMEDVLQQQEDFLDQFEDDDSLPLTGIGGGG